MFKTLLKHKITEIALDNMFNGLIKSFKENKKSIKVGDNYSSMNVNTLIYDSIISSNRKIECDVRAIYYDVVITDISHSVVFFDFSHGIQKYYSYENGKKTDRCSTVYLDQTDYGIAGIETIHV